MSQFIEQLKRLETVEHFAEWLWSALTDWYSDSESKPSELAWFAFHIGAESCSHALSIIYDRHILTERKPIFRAAIGNVLKKCAENGKTDIAPMIEDLIYLSRQVNATEALDGLLATMSTESFMTSKEPNLLYGCLSLLWQISPSEEAFAFTSSLIQLPGFDEGYILKAIRTLTDCQPANAEKIVDSLGARITSLYSIVKHDPVEKSAYWAAIRTLFDKKKDAAVLSRIYSYSV